MKARPGNSELAQPMTLRKVIGSKMVSTTSPDNSLVLLLCKKSFESVVLVAG